MEGDSSETQRERRQSSTDYPIGWIEYLHTPESDLWLVLFRITMGVVVWEEAARMMLPYVSGDVLHSKLMKKMLDSTVLVPHWGCETWLPGIPGEEGLYLMHAGLFLLAIFLVVGFCSRLSATLILLIRGWFFLGNDAFYLNHHYAELLFLMPLCVINSGRSVSIDSLLNGMTLHHVMRPRPVPRYYRITMCSIMFVIYFYSAYSKLSYDWMRGANALSWFRYEKMVRHLGYYSPRLAIVASKSEILQHVYHAWWFKYAIAWGGIVWDLSAPLLCVASWNPLSWMVVAGVGGSIAFHCMNHLHMSVGMFPFMSMAITVVLFLMRPAIMRTSRGDEVTPSVLEKVPEAETATTTSINKMRKRSRISVGMVVAFIFITFLLFTPARDVFYKGNLRQYHKTGDRMSWTQKTYSTYVEVNTTVTLTPLIEDPLTGKLHRTISETLPYKMHYTPLVNLFFRIEKSTDDEEQNVLTPIGDPIVSKEVEERVNARPDQLQRLSRKVARIYQNAFCPVVYNGSVGCEVQFHASGRIFQNDRRPEPYYNATIDMASPELSSWPIDWLPPVPPAEGWLRYETPLVFMVEFVLNPWSENPCLPWNRAHPWSIGKGKELDDRTCAHWWYSTYEGERTRLASSNSWQDSVRRWVAHITAPVVEGYNDEESCSRALYRFYGDYTGLACAATTRLPLKKTV